MREFETGAHRDDGKNKMRMSLLPQDELNRLLKRFLDGAINYGENNWKKGMPLSVYYDSAQRHLTKWWGGDTSEDHAAAALWNIVCGMWTEKNLKDMNDRDKFQP